MLKIARHVFFSFKFHPDIFRVNAIRNQNIILKANSTGYWDDSLYEKSLATNPDYIKRKIREGLKGTSVMVILITSTTYKSEYVKYEYEKNIEIGNGILQLDVSDMEDLNKEKEKFNGWLSYITKGIKKKWYHKCPLGEWVEEAYKNK